MNDIKYIIYSYILFFIHFSEKYSNFKFTMGFISFVGKNNRILENNIDAPKIKIKNQIVNFSNFAIFPLPLFCS